MKGIFEKKHSDLKSLWNIFLDQLKRTLQLSRALAFLGLSACGGTEEPSV